MKTKFVNEADIERKWVLIDAEGQVLGRLATRVAHILRGKHKACWSPEVDAGDYVVVINADKIMLTGNKAETKSYWHANSRPGHSYAVPFLKAIKDNPETPIRMAVKGMLPKNHQGKKMITKLHVYGGGTHPHTAQQPEPLAL
jgi:large subunit ribosomal protein L13